jgi:flavin-dependent thymidylate synthase
MKVTLIAHTMLAMGASGYETDSWIDRPQDVNDADFLGEFAGRACYESWERPNPKTATNEGYVANILDHEHYSVLEHASATFYIVDVSRSLTHELVRHRHLSFSQRSQRYVDETNAPMVYPPALRVDHEFGWALDGAVAAAWNAYEQIVRYLTEVRKMPRKEARQAARCILPNMTSTSIVVTGNHRAWREMLRKRWHVAADAEIRELAGVLLDQLRAIAPNTYQDFPTQPIGTSNGDSEQEGLRKNSEGQNPETITTVGGNEVPSDFNLRPQQEG